MTRFMRKLKRFGLREAGTATVEFVIALPFVLAVLYTSVDFGSVMIRQVFLDRAVDMAVREVRLGNVPSNGHDMLRDLICERTVLLGNCAAGLTIELKPIDTATWAGLSDPITCIDRAQPIQPSLTFNPSAGNQHLMLVRVCASVDPFLSITGMVLGLGNDTGGDLRLIAQSAFTNEPV
jgi:hypothetical protein